MIVNWIRKTSRRTKLIGCELGLFAFLGVLLVGGSALWSHLAGEPRRSEVLENDEKQAERDRQCEFAGAVWTIHSGSIDRVGFARLDPSLVPESERHDWQPPGLVALLGSHSGRHGHVRVRGSITCVCWGSDGKWIYSGGGREGRVRVWEPDDLRELASLEGAGENVLGLAASADGKWLAACGSSEEPTTGWMRIWSVQPDGFEEHASYTWPGSEIKSVAFSPDGRQLAAGSDHGVQVWETSGEKWNPRFTLTQKESSPYSRPTSLTALAFSPDGHRLAAGLGGLLHGKVLMWNLDLEESNQRHWDGLVTGLLVAGGILAAVALLLFVTSRRWRREDSSTLPRPATRSKKRKGSDKAAGDPSRAPTAKDRKRTRRVIAAVAALAVVALSAGGVAWLWGPPALSPVETDEQAEIGALAFSPDGRFLASGDLKGEIRLWQGRDVLSAAGKVQDEEGGSQPCLFGRQSEVVRRPRAHPVASVELPAFARRPRLRAGRRSPGASW
jgi:WD40 repeat protein